MGGGNTKLKRKKWEELNLEEVPDRFLERILKSWMESFEEGHLIQKL